MKILSLTVLALALGACQKTAQSEPEQKKPTQAAPVVAKITQNSACIGPITSDANAAQKKINGQTWEIQGSTATLKSDNKQLTIGVVSDLKDTQGQNIKNLEQIVAWFKSKNADIIVSAGDMGLSQPQIEQSMGVLAKSELPVFSIIGNRESQREYEAALTHVSSKNTNVFNLNTVRRVNTPALDLISMPGYYDINYLHKGDGCVYGEKQVDQLAQLAASCDSPVALISHGGPKQVGPNGIDRMALGDNVGDSQLTKIMKDAKIPFGIFGNIHEAGGKATDLDGKTKLKPKQSYASLYLNPGAADGVAMKMNDGTEAKGMAAVMTIKDGKAQYEVLRL